MKKVTIYSSPTCGFCKMAKEFLNEKNISFTDYDVTVDTDKAQEMVDMTGQMGVPVIIIGEGEEKEVIIGFDRPKVEEALGL